MPDYSKVTVKHEDLWPAGTEEISTPEGVDQVHPFE